MLIPAVVVTVTGFLQCRTNVNWTRSNPVEEINIITIFIILGIYIVKKKYASRLSGVFLFIIQTGNNIKLSNNVEKF